MAKDGDFIMRLCQGWVIGLYNNTSSVNNVTKSICFTVGGGRERGGKAG